MCCTYHQREAGRSSQAGLAGRWGAARWESGRLAARLAGRWEAGPRWEAARCESGRLAARLAGAGHGGCWAPPCFVRYNCFIETLFYKSY